MKERIKNEMETPSFEEFVKDYKVDESLNYDDLNSGNVGEVKGYGPTTYGQINYNSSYRGTVYSGQFNVILEAE